MKSSGLLLSIKAKYAASRTAINLVYSFVDFMLSINLSANMYALYSLFLPTTANGNDVGILDVDLLYIITISPSVK